MKKLIYTLPYIQSLILLFLIITVTGVVAQPDRSDIDWRTYHSGQAVLLQHTDGEKPAAARYERCGQIEYQKYLRSVDPSFDKKRQEFEKEIQRRVVEMEKKKLSPNVQSPVV